MRYKIVLFDIDGTLFDFLRAEKEALRDALTSLGVTVTDNIISDYSQINDSMWKLLERGEIDRETLKIRRFDVLFEKYGICADSAKMAKTYMSMLSEKAFLFDGAEDLCKYVHEKARTYIVTNGTFSVQEVRLKKSGILSFFEDVFVSEKVGYSKPDTRFFDHVAAAIPNFSKENTVIIGDSLSSDIAGGIAFGIDTVWYNPKNEKTLQDFTDKITFTAKNYDEIRSFICGGENNDA